MPTPWMIASRRPKKTKAKNTEGEEALMGSARVSRAGDGVLAIANSSEDTKYTMRLPTLRKTVSARRRNQHARRMHYPDSADHGLNRAPKVCGKRRLISTTSASSVVIELALICAICGQIILPRRREFLREFRASRSEISSLDNATETFAHR